MLFLRVTMATTQVQVSQCTYYVVNTNRFPSYSSFKLHEIESAILNYKTSRRVLVHPKINKVSIDHLEMELKLWH